MSDAKDNRFYREKPSATTFSGPKHPIVKRWAAGKNDAGGCIAELEHALLKAEEKLRSVASHERDIESEEFCNRMQTYRHMKGPQADVVNAYEHVKEYINERLSATPTEEMHALLERAVEAQRNDTRTPAEKVVDGVKFVMGPGGDEGTRPDNPSTQRTSEPFDVIHEYEQIVGVVRHSRGSAQYRMSRGSALADYLLALEEKIRAHERISATSATALKGDGRG